MFHIRRIHDDILPANLQAIDACCSILFSQIPTATERERSRILNCLRDPVKSRFKSVLLTAENRSGVIGFALLMHEPSLKFSYLDFLCSAPGRTSGGIGSSLYSRCREESLALGALAMFFEVHPDHPAYSPDLPTLNQNRIRLKFYERWGARPVTGTLWDNGVAETAPLRGDSGLGTKWNADWPVTYLCCDDLGHPTAPSRKAGRVMLGAILERRYTLNQVPPEETRSIVDSIHTETLQLRNFRYTHKHEPEHSAPVAALPGPIPVVQAEHHEAHWVHDQGYYETPVRIPLIAKALDASGLVHKLPVRHWPDKHISDVHDARYLSFLREIQKKSGKDNRFPDVFPPRQPGHFPDDPFACAGWYCIDAFTPLSAAAITAARHAVDCTLTAAHQLLQGEHCAYSLIRPLGHHAESSLMGGYCYYNNTAIAAHYLSQQLGRIAILDIDYHHGNGQQQIFYSRADILTVSVHADPKYAYPFYSGHADERGEGDGKGYNINIPLPSGCDGENWRQKGLIPALKKIREFKPALLVVACGFDTAKDDPTGMFALKAEDFQENGRIIGASGFPTLFVQEGGYRTATLGRSAMSFFRGFAIGAELIAPDTGKQKKKHNPRQEV